MSLKPLLYVPFIQCAYSSCNLRYTWPRDDTHPFLPDLLHLPCSSGHSPLRAGISEGPFLSRRVAGSLSRKFSLAFLPERPWRGRLMSSGWLSGWWGLVSRVIAASVDCGEKRNELADFLSGFLIND